MRYAFLFYIGVALLTFALVPEALPHRVYLWAFIPCAVLTLIGAYDLVQRRHNLWRNYPLVSRLRWLFEALRPELRQYLFESETDGRPFSREQRALVYRRAKNVNDKHPFGTEHDVYAEDFEWINHSIVPKSKSGRPCRIMVGGPQCSQPYDASVFNISAMSFGALSANAIRALNLGAKIGGFAHDTGEGGLSGYHRAFGGDLIWEIGSGYFGCRTENGDFDPARFEAIACSDQVKMIELKLSQGAKPGHGGVLPGCKVTPEIARARGVLVGEDCISPASHRVFSTPAGLLEFIASLRERSGGKPTGVKLCIGQPVEFMALAKAMLVSEILPDFIVVDGAEGGTGAAPLELSNRVGMPLREGLLFVRNVLVGTGLRDRIRLAASGKITSGYGLAANMALGADWCNAARGFMLSLGCIQSLHCHTGLCPTGIATQSRIRQRAVVVPERAQRVANFHRHTVDALCEIVAAAGLEHPQDLTPAHLFRRNGAAEAKPATQRYTLLDPGALLDKPPEPFHGWWQAANALRFTP